MDISIRLSNGQFLRGFISSPGEDVRAIVILVHGLGEHTGRYRNWAAKFSSRGIGFAALDLPGHGKSDGRRGHISGYSIVDEMLNTLILQCRKTFPGIPLILYGHSLGGGIVLRYLLDERKDIKAAVVTSPFLKLAFEPARVKVKMASFMKHLLPSLVQPSGLEVTHLSHDENVVNAYRNDELVHGKISVSLFHNAMSAAATALSRASDLKTPLLLVHGSDDMITSPEGSRQFAATAKNTTLRIWEGGYHELHNEPFSNEVFEYICGWVEARI